MTSVIRSEVVERTTNIHQEEKLFIVKIRRGRSKNTLLQVKVQIYYQLNVLKVTKVKKTTTFMATDCCVGANWINFTVRWP